MKSFPQAVKIYKRVFSTDKASIQRFRNLMTAFQQGIILADNIFLSLENNSNIVSIFPLTYLPITAYYLYIVEPAFSSYQDKFIQLSNLLKLNLDREKKLLLFKNLTKVLNTLHDVFGTLHDLNHG